VYGARLTGGGFGGCTVNLVHDSAVGDVVERLSAEYRARTRIRLEAYVSDAAGHAGAFPPVPDC
jgi:galactokinase